MQWFAFLVNHPLYHFNFTSTELPIVLNLLLRWLREFGWDAVGFTNPVAALGVFKVAPWAFELIVTDRRMPQMSGDELVLELLDSPGASWA